MTGSGTISIHEERLNSNFWRTLKAKRVNLKSFLKEQYHGLRMPRWSAKSGPKPGLKR